MLRRSEQAQERWTGNHQAIDRWLNERQELLVLYCKTAGLPPFDSDKQQLPALKDIREFCSLLMDYISAGHFEVYDQIIQASPDKAKEMAALADELYPLIAQTTDVALAFNDLYGDADEHADLGEFDERLSGLGETIELRMEFEDRLLATLDQHDLIGA